MRVNFKCRPDDGAPIILACPIFEESGAVVHGFSTRLGGVSAAPYNTMNLGLNTKDSAENVKENYRRFCKMVGIDEHNLVLTHQVHSANIKIVSKSDAGKGLCKQSDLGDVDGLITAERGLPIGIFYADCTPILLLDPKKRVVAAIHSGWRGTLSRIGRKAVQIMKMKFGCNPEDILAAFGPSIKECSFEVGEDVFVEFCESFGTRALLGSRAKDNKFFIDTDNLNKRQLIEEGLKEENISICNMCTYCNNDIFYSHRADGGVTGRMCAIIEII